MSNWISHLQISRPWDLVPHISFLWPSMLWLMLVVPLLVLCYVLLLRRRKKVALRYGNFPLVRQAMGQKTWRRHVPPALLLASLVLLIVAIARPAAKVTLPTVRSTVILAMDVSGSMRAADVEPSRLGAAELAAKQYIKDQPRDVKIGIVAFAATAFLVQNPTTDHASLTSAIDRFELQRGTAVGSAILVSLSTLFPSENFPINTFNSGNFGWGGPLAEYENSQYSGTPLGSSPEHGPRKRHVPVEPGSYKNAAIILLTDGATNAGYDPMDAARIASDYGVRVYTVGFGTERGDIVGFRGFMMRAQLDEEALKKIADMTKGRYYHATSANDLKAIYGELSKQLVMETQEMEITAFFAAAAAFLMCVSAALSVAWFGRIF